MIGNKINRYFLFGIFFSWGVFLLLGCASIPKEAPQLSSELGKRIAAIENSHISLLRLFMDEKRAKVDEFMMNEWVPVFAKELFSETKIRERWEQVCKEGTENDRIIFLTTLGPRIQAKINTKRIELIQPLDELERTIERRLRDEYLQAKAINNSITSFLVSAAEVAENRDRFLNMVGLDDQKLVEALDVADSAVSDLVAETKDKEEKFNIFKSKIESVLKKLR